MDILTLLHTLATLYTQQAALRAQEHAALPATLRARLAQVQARFAPQHAGLARDVALVESQVKAAVLAHGQSVKGERLHAVYVRGKTHWDTAMLGGYALHHPEVLRCSEPGKPSVTLRKVPA